MDTHTNEPAQEQHLFDDYSHRVVQAGSGKRLANYIIDVIVFYLLMIAAGVLLALLNPSALDTIAASDGVGFNLLDRLLSLLLYGIYMGIIESVFKGRSLGKLITGTKAVNADGTNINIQTAFLRGLSRAVPFNAFSALGNPCYPWHDKWTKTLVIDIRESGRP